MNLEQSAVIAVDPDHFLKMMAVFQQGIAKPIRRVKGKGWHLVDDPLNRAMMAVVTAMGEAGQSQETMPATMLRLMNMGKVLEHHARFGRSIVPAPDCAAHTLIANPLLRAIAVARMISVNAHLQFDLDDVDAHLSRFEAEGQPGELEPQ